MADLSELSPYADKLLGHEGIMRYITLIQPNGTE
jgi:hypothetical protein